MLFKLAALVSRQLRHTHCKAGAAAAMAGDHGMSLKAVVDELEAYAPKHLAEPWDNTGLLLEPYTPRNVTDILLTNDLTEEVALEATALGAQLIISYHPPIFAPLKSITQSAWKERVVSLLLERGVALYSPHTRWDAVSGGVNDWLASAFRFRSSAPLAPAADPRTGAGRLLELEPAVSLEEAVASVKRLTGLAHVRVAAPAAAAAGAAAAGGRPLRRVALCAGSGGSVLKGVDADLYLTGEMLHHDVLDAAQRGVAVLLTNHSDSERGFLPTVAPLLAARLGGRVALAVSRADRDPLTTV